MAADPESTGANRSAFELLVVECLERVEQDGVPGLDEFCREHPGEAEALRSAVTPLIDVGAAGPARTLRQIGDFELIREIGRGGMGVVYEARQRSIDRRVALKVMLAHLTLDATTVERFRREGQLVGALQHPGIVQVHSVGSEDGHYFIAMEFIDGAPLDRVVRNMAETTTANPETSLLRTAIHESAHRGGERRAATPVAETTADDHRIWRKSYIETVVGIAAQIADALEHAHSAGVIHRDVKPSNVLVRSDGTALLTDFGLARRDDLPGLTRTGAFAGTPYYTSPEQAKVSRDIDHRTDVFSLGATLYELLTLRRPFEGGSSQEILQAIQIREPVDPQRLNRRLSADLGAIVLKALEKEPRRRYQTAGELAADLRAFLAYRPVAARRASTVERVRRWAVRQPLRAALVIVLIVGIPTVAALGGFLIANRPLVEAAERQERLDHAEAALLAAYTRSGEARHRLAIDAVHRALELHPDNVEAVALLAYSQLMTEGANAAAALATIEARPEMLAAHRALQRIRAWCLQRSGRAAEGDAELERLGEPTEALEAHWAGMLLYERSQELLAEEPARKALDYLHDAVIKSKVARPAFHHKLAAVAGHQDDLELATRAAEALETLWPDLAYAWNGIGQAFWRLDPERSVRAYRRSLELDPDVRGTRNNLGNSLTAMARRAKTAEEARRLHDEAVAEYRRCIEQFPDHGIAFYNLGKALFATYGDPPGAIPILRRATELLPTEARAHHYLLWALTVEGRFDEALEAGRVALGYVPQVAILRRDMAKVHVGLKQFDRAIAECEKGIELAPEQANNYFTLSDVYVAQGELDAARRAFERGVEATAPARRARAREDFAWFLLKRRGEIPPIDPPAALVIAQEMVAATDRTDPYQLNLLGEALRLCDRREAALEAIETGLKLATDERLRDGLKLRKTTVLKELGRDR